KSTPALRNAVFEKISIFLPFPCYEAPIFGPKRSPAGSVPEYCTSLCVGHHQAVNWKIRTILRKTTTPFAGTLLLFETLPCFSSLSYTAAINRL
ncbi:MAG: hypothetical protein KDI74_18710, partial [Gammaproteobacteria bacterium]|nr:hypothetical protein [Gammaproteobacteria bacterium]